MRRVADCRHCGETIARNAHRCPHCGGETATGTAQAIANTLFGTFMVVMVLLFIGLV